MLEKELIFENLYHDGAHLWFTARDYNALFRMDTDNREPELIGSFPGEGILQYGLYSAMAKCNGKLYFAPFAANEIAAYDTETGQFRKIAVALPNIENGRCWKQAKFFNVVSTEKKVYFLPFFYPGILVLDIGTGKFTCIDDWIGEIERIRVGDWGYFRETVLAGQELVLPCMCADAVVIVDTVTETSRMIKTPPTSRLCRHSGIFYTEPYFYLISADGTVAKRRLESEEEEIKNIHVPVSAEDEIVLYPLQYVDHIIYLLPSKSDQGYQIDTRTDKVAATELFEDEKRFMGDTPLYIACTSAETKLYVFTGNSHRLITYDLEFGSMSACKLYMSEQDRLRMETVRRAEFTERVCSEGIRESRENSLVYMLGILDALDEDTEKDQNGYREETGNRIYHALVSEGDMQA